MSTSGSRYSHDDIAKLISGTDSTASSRSRESQDEVSVVARLKKGIDCSCSKDYSKDSKDGCAFAKKVPFSNMIDLIENHSCCDEDIPADKRKLAAQAFKDVTGYVPINLTEVFNIFHNETQTLIRYNGLYLFLVIFILALLLVLAAVATGILSWAVALFLIGLIFILVYTFSLIYRIQVSEYTNSQHKEIQQHSTQSQNNFQNSIAYWPQGLFAVAAAVTSHGGTGATGWTCNECKSPTGCFSEFSGPPSESCDFSHNDFSQDNSWHAISQQEDFSQSEAPKGSSPPKDKKKSRQRKRYKI